MYLTLSVHLNLDWSSFKGSTVTQGAVAAMLESTGLAVFFSDSTSSLHHLLQRSPSYEAHADHSTEYTLTLVLIHSGCYNRTPQIEWFTNDRHLFLTVVGWSPRSRCWQICCLVSPASWFIDGRLFPVTSWRNG